MTPDSAELPRAVDVAIVGGGIIGAATALALASSGLRTLLCEKGAIGAEQSGRNWGFIRTVGRSRAELPLALASRPLWEEAAAAADFGYRRAGYATLAATAGELARQEAWLDAVRDFRLDARLLRGPEIAALLPGIAGRWAGLTHAPLDAAAEPGPATRAFARLAASRGAILREACAVRGVERQAGRVAGIVTEAGSVACAAVVLAGGAWSRLFALNAGISLPQLRVLGSVCRVEGAGSLPDTIVSSAGFSFRKRADGGVTLAQRGTSVTDIVPDTFRLLAAFLPAFRRQRRNLRLRLGRHFLAEARIPRRFALDRPSPFEAVRILDPAPVADILTRALANARAAFAGFASARIAEVWAGLIDATPDELPIISPAASVPGLFIATGFSAHGFGIGPAAGRLVADLVTGVTPIVDPTPFRFDRFPRFARA
jgi:glycine/D-amino acid oxidase-like deaminating enzyme